MYFIIASPCIQISIIGTPDEEDDGGKVVLINNNTFVDVDVTMMAHPWNANVVPIPGFVALQPLVYSTDIAITTTSFIGQI